MISVNDLKPGNNFSYENEIYLVLDTMHNKTAMRQMVIKLKVKNLHSGTINDMSFTGGDKVENVHLDKKQMNYLYNEGDFLVFMDNETYEQVSIHKTALKWELNFLRDGTECEVTYYGTEIMGILLPTKVPLKIVATEPAVRGDTVNKAMKEATLETGYIVKVPLFVEEGIEILVRTDTGEYDSRA